MIKTSCWQDKSQWHKWFAWHPVWTAPTLKADRYCHTRIWWEPCLRRIAYPWGEQQKEYRMIEE